MKFKLIGCLVLVLWVGCDAQSPQSSQQQSQANTYREDRNKAQEINMSLYDYLQEGLEVEAIELLKANPDHQIFRVESSSIQDPHLIALAAMFGRAEFVDYMLQHYEIHEFDLGMALLESVKAIDYFGHCAIPGCYWIDPETEYGQAKFKITKQLLEAGAPVDHVDHDMRTALFYACQYASVQQFELLVEHEATVNTVDIYGLTPLAMAAACGWDALATDLLKLGASPNLKTQRNENLFHILCVNPDYLYCYFNTDISLVAPGMNYFQLSLVGKLYLREDEHHQHWLDKWIDPESDYAIAQWRILKETAALNENDINARNDDGLTPLHFAVLRGDIHLFDLLVENGADVSIPTATGATVLELAREVGNPQIISRLSEPTSE